MSILLKLVWHLMWVGKKTLAPKLLSKTEQIHVMKNCIHIRALMDTELNEHIELVVSE